MLLHGYFLLLTPYSLPSSLSPLWLSRVMSKEDFDYRKKNLTGLVEWYFKNQEVLKKGAKSGNIKEHPSGNTRKANKETTRVRDHDPHGDIPTREIPYGDPRLDNVENPYEDINTRDIPL